MRDRQRSRPGVRGQSSRAVYLPEQNQMVGICEPEEWSTAALKLESAHRHSTEAPKQLCKNPNSLLLFSRLHHYYNQWLRVPWALDLIIMLLAFHLAPPAGQHSHLCTVTLWNARLSITDDKLFASGTLHWLCLETRSNFSTSSARYKELFQERTGEYLHSPETEL